MSTSETFEIPEEDSGMLLEADQQLHGPNKPEPKVALKRRRVSEADVQQRLAREHYYESDSPKPSSGNEATAAVDNSTSRGEIIDSPHRIKPARRIFEIPSFSPYWKTFHSNDERNAPLCPQCDELLQSYPSAEEFYLHLCQTSEIRGNVRFCEHKCVVQEIGSEPSSSDDEHEETREISENE